MECHVANELYKNFKDSKKIGNQHHEYTKRVMAHIKIYTKNNLQKNYKLCEEDIPIK